GPAPAVLAATRRPWSSRPRNPEPPPGPGGWVTAGYEPPAPGCPTAGCQNRPWPGPLRTWPLPSLGPVDRQSGYSLPAESYPACGPTGDPGYPPATAPATVASAGSGPRPATPGRCQPVTGPVARPSVPAAPAVPSHRYRSAVHALAEDCPAAQTAPGAASRPR